MPIYDISVYFEDAVILQANAGTIAYDNSNIQINNVNPASNDNIPNVGNFTVHFTQNGYPLNKCCNAYNYNAALNIHTFY